MIAIILAAGQGTRLRPITDNIPKPMVKINNKPILEYILEKIYDKVDEIIIVVGYKKETIINYFGNNFKGKKIIYHNQGEKKGTAAAIMGLKSDNDIFLINGDSIFESKDLEKIINLNTYGALVLEVEDPEKYGIFKQNNEGFATEIIEKPSEFVGNLANLGVYKFSNDILKYAESVELSKRGEYEITDAINMFLKENKFKLEKVEGKFIDISYPEDIEKAENKLNKTENINLIELTKEILDKNFDSFMETIENLKPNGSINKEKILDYFEESNKSSKTFILQKDNSEIIGSIKVIIEYKVIRGGVKAGKIEDVAVKNGYQGLGLGAKLMKKALEYAESEKVYKITLSCRDEVLPFMKNFDLKNIQQIGKSIINF